MSSKEEGSKEKENAQVTIGEKHSIYSEVLSEERPYWVHLPASYHDSTYAPQHYPVLYLLDGDAHFHSATGVINHMSASINGNIQIPELIVVALPSTNRLRDLTPTHTKIGYEGKEDDALEKSGGGDAFLQFIREELFPEVESRYRTRSYRILTGHSLGGLIVLHALLNTPTMFQAYIAIDPSLWWDNQRLTKQLQEYNRELNGTVYITLANNFDIGEDNSELMARSGQTFITELERVPRPRLRQCWKYFEAEDHGSIPLQSLYYGLLYIFESYKPPNTIFKQPSYNKNSF